MSGTDIAYRVITLRASYAMSGTDIGPNRVLCDASCYRPMQVLRDARSLHISHSMSGTDPAYQVENNHVDQYEEGVTVTGQTVGFPGMVLRRPGKRIIWSYDIPQ
eukprot:3941139-Rhodomonas_salina.2